MRPNVFLATELRSRTASKALTYFDEEDAAVKSSTILKLNNGFDTLNSRQETADTPLRCGFGIHEEDQTNALMDVKGRAIIITVFYLARFVKTMNLCF